MSFNLKNKCESSKDREFFYGAKLNKDIKDVYMGYCFLHPGEADRKVGPGRGHEELLYLINGKIEIIVKDQKILMNEGDIYYIPDGLKVRLKNISDERVNFMVAGGHTKPHKH